MENLHRILAARQRSDAYAQSFRMSQVLHESLGTACFTKLLRQDGLLQAVLGPRAGRVGQHVQGASEPLCRPPADSCHQPSRQAWVAGL